MRGPQGWAFAVADDGTGIPAARRQAVFAMFAQLDPAARTGRDTGHGTGPATCQRVAERHGGRCWTEETPGGTHEPA